MRRKAGKAAPGVIDQPNLVIFGTAIPNHYYEALSERMLTNGFFARMVILESGPRCTGTGAAHCRRAASASSTPLAGGPELPTGTGNLQDWHPVPAVVEPPTSAKRTAGRDA
jgi:hypothetical protein